jgi:hypothetical protein
MTCYNPRQAVLLDGCTTPSGKAMFFGDYYVCNYPDKIVYLPCRRCVGCRLSYSLDVSVRSVHEVASSDDSCFITLTYDDKHCPPTLIKKDFQDFAKRLRKRVGIPIKIFYCGEYGSLNFRPHFHAIIYNYDFPDKKRLFIRNKNPLYTSALLSDLWEHKGYVTIGAATAQSSAYVARYVLKKKFGDSDDVIAHYNFVDIDTGETFSRQREFAQSPNRFGYSFFSKYKHEFFRNHFIIFRDRKVPIPDRYKIWYKDEHPDLYADYSERCRDYSVARKERLMSDDSFDFYKDLVAAERIQQNKIEGLVRNL